MFSELYKKDNVLIKPGEAFIEDLSAKMAKESSRLRKTPRFIKIYAFAAAALTVLVAAVAGALNMSNAKKFDDNSGNSSFYGAVVDENTTIGEAARLEEADALDKAYERTYEAPEAGAPARRDTSKSEYVVLKTDEISEIRLYNDGRLEIIMNGESFWFYAKEGDNG